jgi:hypothetical protein
MTYLLAAAAVFAAAFLTRHFTTPTCPRCRARSWDRRLCAPLLFCRKCATRIDSEGRVYN